MSYESCHWVKWNMAFMSNWLCQSAWWYFWKGPQYHYYSVWKVVYFPQNPLNLKSKKVKFLKGKILPLGVWLHKFPFIFSLNLERERERERDFQLRKRCLFLLLRVPFLFFQNLEREKKRFSVLFIYLFYLYC